MNGQNVVIFLLDWWRHGRGRPPKMQHQIRGHFAPQNHQMPIQRAQQQSPKYILLLLALLLSISLPSEITAIQFPSSVFNNDPPPPPSQSAPSSSIRSVNTPFGIVRGQLVAPQGMPMADSPLPPVVQYLSIPYGSAPSGHHRFKMAISAPKWTHQPKDAFRQPPACIQSGLPALSESDALKVTSAQRFDRLHRILPLLKPQSEDCLFMDLFVPERRELRDALPLSVLVLVHGDTDYGWGGAAAQNGTLLAAFGRIVVVTLNYRLGVYGFLGRCDPEATNSCAGNAGLSDLVAALKMLSLLLPSFGADPDSVTLLGWESGAALVSLLMASPITQPKGRLFRRAILLDGSALAPWAMADGPQEQFMRLASELKCLGGDGLASNGGTPSEPYQKEAARILHCLQDHSAQNLSAAARKVANASPTFLSTFAPIIDGQVVPNHPSLSFSPKYGGLFREIDLLIGTVHHPAQHLMADQDIQHGVGPERRDKIIRTLVRNIFDFHRTEILQAILNEYTDWENPRNHPKSIRNGLMAALGDLLFTTPLIETARAHSLQDQGPLKATANTFLFVFGHETGGWMREHGGQGSGLRGSFTGDHLPYMLGQPFTENEGGGEGAQFSAEDKQLCRVMMTYLANFVKSGDPTRPQPMSAQSAIEDRFQGLPWPQFSAQNREAYLEILDRPRVKNYYRNSFVQFWSGFIPVLNRPGAGEGGKEVPEEHHLLPDHFDRATFFGEPRPFSTFHNIPFPPPPLPPTPFPKELRKQLIASLTITTMRPPGGSGESTQRPAGIASSSSGEDGTKRAEYNPSWGWLILIGVALTVVNLCILGAISRQCLRRCADSKSKKFQYYASPPGGQIGAPTPAGIDMNFAALMSGQQSRRSSQFPPNAGQSRPNRQSAMDFAEEMLLQNDPMANANNNSGRKMNAMENGNTISANANTASVATIHLHRRRSSLTSGSGGGIGPGIGAGIAERTATLTTKMVGGTFGGTSLGGSGGIGGAHLMDKSPLENNSNSSAVVVLAADADASTTTTTTIQMADEVPEKFIGIGSGGRHSIAIPSIGQPFVLGKRAGNSAAFPSQRDHPHHFAHHRASAGHLTSILPGTNAGGPSIGGLTNGGGGGHHQRASLQENQQEPLLSAAGSLKGSTPSVMIQPPSGAAGLIRLGTGISPTCPRHGRAAQMLLAANRGTGGGNFGGQSQMGGGGNGQNEGGQQNIQLQQQSQLEEVQV